MSLLPPFTPPAILTHVPDGYDTLLLSELAQREERVVYIARDEGRALRLKTQLTFFDPFREVLFFPGWDCLPYDRSSPHPDILAQRLNTLTTLTSQNNPYLLITTIQALVQRLPPLDAFQGRLLTLNAGQEVDHEA